MRTVNKNQLQKYFKRSAQITDFRSGGQKGADIGAFDAFVEYVENNPNVKKKEYKEHYLVVEFKNGNVWRLTGWCPEGRRWEGEGKIPEKYPLQETKTDDYKERTELNVKDADATLIMKFSTFDSDKDGTGLTIDKANELNKPLKIVNLDEDVTNNISEVFKWIKENNIKHLNMAGPRASTCEGIYDKTLRFMSFLLKELEDYQKLIEKNNYMELSFDLEEDGTVDDQGAKISRIDDSLNEFDNYVSQRIEESEIIQENKAQNDSKGEQVNKGSLETQDLGSTSVNYTTSKFNEQQEEMSPITLEKTTDNWKGNDLKARINKKFGNINSHSILKEWTACWKLHHFLWVTNVIQNEMIEIKLNANYFLSASESEYNFLIKELLRNPEFSEFHNIKGENIFELVNIAKKAYII
ncbi:putative molybdenum carrier-domain-containing protein [Gigaspora rosea]|uniref:Putative molybdenum carrier-domain-containing protein n=1 Tax=Gigaspora rosea TaxID=44941 RepID=A0A397WBU4_9GLOM|nr:putative molybdenum carrier-domain-containing protein [Gigaspora rosea]